MRDAGFGVPHELAAIQSEINFLIAEDLAGRLAQVSANIAQAQTVLGKRIEELKDTISTAASVFWTKVYVFTIKAS